MAPKTEDQIFLERLGVLSETDHRDSDYEPEDNPLEELAFREAELSRKEDSLRDWESRLQRRESRLNARESDLNQREEELDLKEDSMWDKVPEDSTSFEELTPEELEEKRERLRKRREAATAQPNAGVWSTGWNT
jgi:hypothetical protein